MKRNQFVIKMTVGAWILAAMLMPATARAALTLGALFQDHMVLQRDMPIPVWGKADPGATVIVTFAKQKKITTTDAEGKWRIDLDSLSASFEPRTLTVSAKRKSATENLQCSDVLIGEVWICSGQSNMQFSVNAVPEAIALIPTAENICSFTVNNTVAFTEQDTCEGTWLNSYPNSAVAFSFAYFLEEAADVPVGIILSCWGST